MKDLQQLRLELDEIDQQMVDLLARRFGVTHQVGEYKRDNNIPPVDRSREELQFARIEKLATASGLDPEFAKSILRLIIDAVVENHKKLQS